MNVLTKTFQAHKKAATIGLIVGAVILSTGVGVACKGYIDNQAKLKLQATENQKRLETEKIAQQKAEEEAKAKLAADEAAKLAAANQPATVPAPAPKPAVAPPSTKPKPTSEPTKKTEQKPSYETVSVNVSGSGAATIGSSKPGTCYWTVKNHNTGEIKELGTTSATGGSCSVAVPAGSWTKLYVTYKANDYSAKGSAYHMF